MVTKTESILLDDEEIKEASREYPASMLNYNPPQLRRIAKAQLKKVVEWLEQYHIQGIEGNPGDVPVVFSDGGYRIPTKDVQALLKEVE